MQLTLGCLGISVSTICDDNLSKFIINELSHILAFCLVGFSEPKTLANRLLKLLPALLFSLPRWHCNFSPLEMLLKTRKANKTEREMNLWLVRLLLVMLLTNTFNNLKRNV